MNLPQITAYIGKHADDGEKDEFSSIIKAIKPVREEKNEKPYVVALVFDLEKEKIYFELEGKQTQDTAKKYYYFGNNAAAGFQYHLARESSSLKYLLSSGWNDFYHMLVRYNLHEKELGRLIKKLEEKELLSLGEKKGQGAINLQRFSIVQEGQAIELIDKNIILGEKKYNFEAFIRCFIDNDNKSNRYTLVVPIVKTAEERIIPSQHTDYLQLVKLDKNLGEENDKAKKKQEKRVCHICQEVKKDVSSQYSKKLSRTGINKIFTTTTINTSPYSKNYNYDTAYGICSQCYRHLLDGEKLVAENFKGKIAGEAVFIMPEGMNEFFNYSHAYTLKEKVDMAFSPREARNFLNDIKSWAKGSSMLQYNIHFVFYRTDGNSVTVLQTIEDVPTLHFKKVVEALEESEGLFEDYLTNFSLGHIYGLVPVRTNNKGDQLDIARVLSLYKALLSKEIIHYQTILSYATEALDKGLKQITKNQCDNYYNMGVRRYIRGGEDFFIRKTVMGYLALLRTCQDLNLLNRNIFNPKEEGIILKPANEISVEITQTIMEMEEFLDQQGFGKEARALFYIGVLLHRAMVAQVMKGHKTKPILKKVQFQGMNIREINRLYLDILEKLNQYNKFTFSVETFIKQLNAYYSYTDSKKEWSLDEHANIIYMMAGYSYMVGRKSSDLTPQEQQAQQDINLEEEDEAI